MRFGPMIAAVISGDIARQPTVRLGFGLGFVEMIKCLVRILDRAERPLNLTRPRPNSRVTSRHFGKFPWHKAFSGLNTVLQRHF